MELILKYFPDLSDTQKEQFAKLKELYTDWNEKINVVSRKDIDNIYEKHILHSLAIAKYIDFKDGSKIMDVGTGGGFPAIPLAIMFPEVNFYAIDIIAKKITVVNGVAESLGLTNIKAEQMRAEKVSDKFDFIVSRAVTQMPKFVGWVRKRTLKVNNHDIRNGIIYLKGGDLTEEFKNFQAIQQNDISQWFEEDFFETKKVVYLPMKYKK